MSEKCWHETRKTNILEIFSAGGDPFLTGEVAFEMIQGIQSQGVQACAKHLINKFGLYPSLTGSGADTLLQRAGTFPHEQLLECGRQVSEIWCRPRIH